HRPGYQTVQDQLRTPRFDLPVVGVQVTPDRRTLILVTAPHPEAAGYAVTLPGLGRQAKVDAAHGELPQLPQTDLLYDLGGAEPSWHAADGPVAWTGWLPHLDLGVSRKLTTASAPHDELWARCRQPGELVLHTKINLWDMLRPAVQPGSKIDYEWPAEEVTLVLSANVDLEVTRAGKAERVEREKNDRRVVRLKVKAAADAPVPLDVVLPTGAGDVELSVSYFTNEDARPRALQVRRFLLPWAALKKDPAAELVERDIPELRGGNWERGRKLFFGDAAACSRCHAVGGTGGIIGPDLSNLPHRDYASVLRDIAEPSYAINPDYVTHLVTTTSGRVLVGTVRTEGDKVHVGDSRGQVLTLRRGDIESMQTSHVSVMPEGLPKELGPERMRDLMTFLLTPPPRMPDYGKAPAPPPRPLREVRAVLAGAVAPTGKPRPLHVVLVAGKKDHGPGEHDYPAWQKVWQKLLALAEETRVTTAWDWPTADE